MSKFKVGDKVRVREDIKVDTMYNTWRYTKDMHDGYSAKILTIKEVHEFLGHHYHIIEDDCRYSWTDDMLERATFTKSDLKDGMVVETRDGYLFLVIGNRVYGALVYGFLNDWIDDLTNPASSDLDIVKVYTVADGATNISAIFNCRNLELVWERKEPCKEMTVEEIEKELGYKIKVVGDTSCQK